MYMCEYMYIILMCVLMHSRAHTREITNTKDTANTLLGDLVYQGCSHHSFPERRKLPAVYRCCSQRPKTCNCNSSVLIQLQMNKWPDGQIIQEIHEHVQRRRLHRARNAPYPAPAWAGWLWAKRLRGIRIIHLSCIHAHDVC